MHQIQLLELCRVTKSHRMRRRTSWPQRKKAKALFRRAQAQSEGFGNYDKAKADLEKAVEYAPEDKGIQQELKRIKQVVSKADKAADKKMGGFLNASKKVASGEGIFDDKLRPSDSDIKADPSLSSEPKITDIKKLSDGLWLCPKDESQKSAEEEASNCRNEDGEQIDFEELSREINEMREDRPEVYNQLKEKVKTHLEEAVKEEEGKEIEECN